MAKEPKTETADTEEKVRKSIVPKGWKSKNDELAEFVKAQCTDKDGFSYDTFFQLCLDNGVDKAEVDKYREVLAGNGHGRHGRVKMTLRNMLEPIARKNGMKLKGVDGKDEHVNVPARATTGAAKKAQETAEAA